MACLLFLKRRLSTAFTLACGERQPFVTKNPEPGFDLSPVYTKNFKTGKRNRCCFELPVRKNAELDRGSDLDG
jgi:hypothetical protein